MATAARLSSAGNRSQRTALSTIVYVVSFVAAMASNYALWLYFTRLHDGSDIQLMVQSFANHEAYFRSVTIALAFGTGLILSLSGRVGARLWAADPSQNKALSWICLISEIAFLGGWSVAVGLGMTACQLYHYTTPEITHALFGAYGIVAAILGIVWTPFGIAAFIISIRSGLFPRWLNILTLAATAFNFTAVGGLFMMTGPFNPYNGQIAVGFPFYGLVTWYFMVSAWLMDRRV